MKPEFVWVFTENHRVYREGGGGGPIWREHWLKSKVVGETRVSWITERGSKIPKKNHNPALVAFSEAEIDEREWVRSHKWGIVRLVECVQDPAVLKRIGALVGFEAKR